MQSLEPVLHFGAILQNLGGTHLRIHIVLPPCLLCGQEIFKRLTLLVHSGIVLEKVAEYFLYNYKNKNQEDVPDVDIQPELCLELLMAADFLDCECFPNPFSHNAHTSVQVECVKTEQMIMAWVALNWSPGKQFEQGSLLVVSYYL